MNNRTIRWTLAAVFSGWAVAAQAQVVIDSGSTSRSAPTVTTPPSVDNGVANGVVKHSGAPSVGNGIANGVAKPAGSPSVDNGVANGSAKSTTVQQ